MSKRAFLIHGYEGRPEHGWILWLKDALEKKGVDSSAPLMPNADHPKMQEWVSKIDELVGSVDEDCVFVGHSLGVIAILRYIEQLPKDKKIGGAVLVAGFTSDLGIADLSNFYEKPIDWDAIRSHQGKYIALHSDNDPWVSIHYADFFQKELHADIVMQPGMKHFSGMDGIIELPIALESVLKLTI